MRRSPLGQDPMACGVWDSKEGLQWRLLGLLSWMCVTGGEGRGPGGEVQRNIIASVI